MGAPFRLPILRAPRSLHSLRYRVALVILILGLIQQQRLFFIYRNALSAKYSPTVFDADLARVEPRSWQQDEEDAQLQSELIANRNSWRHLGSGFEGSAFTYNDLVIKTYTAGRSPFRNCAHCQPNAKWPTEIPASLYFGNLTASGIANTSYPHAKTSDFLPVKAYFLAAASPNSAPEWHLVTPFLREGNLEMLSRTIRRADNLKGFNELDVLYRPTFNRLLRTLESMHSAGFCHDDIKPSNIFVQNDAHWILGDLGNVRHLAHPYHFSQIWKDNKQLHDCRANDAVRALKTYLTFLRSAANDMDTFDAEFFKGRVPLSKLFWGVAADSATITTGELHARSLTDALSPTAMLDTVHPAMYPAQQSAFFPTTFSNRHRVEKDVKRALRMRLGDDTARFFGMTRIFGVPETSC